MIDFNQSRWGAVITYRSKSGDVDVFHDIEELEEIHNIVERGPNWNAIVNISITLQRVCEEGLTIEAINGH